MPKRFSPTARVSFKQLTALLENSNMAIPFKNEKSWHYLFYELKKDKKAAGRPPFFDELEFDSGRAISEISRTIGFPTLVTLGNASVSASNPHYETINLSQRGKEYIDQETRRTRRQNQAVLCLSPRAGKEGIWVFEGKAPS